MSNDLSEIVCAFMTMGYEMNSPSKPPITVRDIMGDPLSEQAMHILRQSSGSHLGDNPHKEPEPDRFLVYWVSETEHTIIDHEDRQGPEITVLTSLLLNPLFCLVGWYHKHVGRLCGYSSQEIQKVGPRGSGLSMGVPLGLCVAEILQNSRPYEKDTVYYSHPERFKCLCLHDGSYEVRDYAKAFCIPLPIHLLLCERFEVARWFKARLTRAYGRLCDELEVNAPEYNILRLLERGAMTPAEQHLDDVACRIYMPPADVLVMSWDSHLFMVELNGQQIPADTYPALHWTAAVTKDFKQVIPKPLVVVVHINGHPARVLIDSGSLSGFMSVTLADQLKIPHIELAKPIVMQLAVQGSWLKVNFGATA